MTKRRSGKEREANEDKERDAKRGKGREVIKKVKEANKTRERGGIME